MERRSIYPEPGSLVTLSFTPVNGRVAAGPRPALVLSAEIYHHRTPLAVVCPIAAKGTGYPFEIELPPGLPVSGVVLVDHVASIDRAARGLEVVGTAPRWVVEEARAKLAALLGW